MDRSPLNDPAEYPDEIILARHLRAAQPCWDSFVGGAAEAVEGVKFTWRFYRDGKAWLCRVTRRDRTICWVSVWDGCFKATFYFAASADADVGLLDIDQALKEAYASAPRTGTLKPLTVEVRGQDRLVDLYRLMHFKAAR